MSMFYCIPHAQKWHAHINSIHGISIRFLPLHHLVTVWSRLKVLHRKMTTRPACTCESGKLKGACESDAGRALARACWNANKLNIRTTWRSHFLGQRQAWLEVCIGETHVRNKQSASICRLGGYGLPSIHEGFHLWHAMPTLIVSMHNQVKWINHQWIVISTISYQKSTLHWRCCCREFWTWDPPMWTIQIAMKKYLGVSACILFMLGFLPLTQISANEC